MAPAESVVSSLPDYRDCREAPEQVRPGFRASPQPGRTRPHWRPRSHRQSVIPGPGPRRARPITDPPGFVRHSDRDSPCPDQPIRDNRLFAELLSRLLFDHRRVCSITCNGFHTVPAATAGLVHLATTNLLSVTRFKDEVF